MCVRERKSVCVREREIGEKEKHRKEKENSQERRNWEQAEIICQR